MKKTTVFEIGTCLSEALANGKKNILFVSATLEYECALKWLNENTEYKVVRFTQPSELYELKNGICVKQEGCYVISDALLDSMNEENAIVFMRALGEECTMDFEGVLNIIKDRFYINSFSDGAKVRRSLEQMKMFIAFTTPAGRDVFSMDEKYYELFDEVYEI